MSEEARERTERFQFTGELSPASLSEDNIRKIADGLARQIAEEVSSARSGVDTALHLRIGGQHSRVFSRGPDHKNTIHSNVIVGGSGG